MPVIGYSDRINHAFGFAAKHHDQQVRKGTRLPYLTHPANVAVILTRYGRDEETVVAGILHDVIEGCVREGWSLEKLEERIGSKFGNSVLNTALSVAERRVDDDGVELSIDERQTDCLARLALATEDALWVSAAHNLHNVNSVLSDLRRTSFPETVWGRFAAGREGTVRRYVDFANRLAEIGFRGAIVDELRAAAHDLQALGNN
ncbi:MAG: HD domain-containing protein [Gemmatimonadaceae bacterium]